MFRPIAISIKVGGGGGGLAQGKLRLGIWTFGVAPPHGLADEEQAGASARITVASLLWASTHRRVGSKLITLPMILILGNEWEALVCLRSMKMA
ncbi:hypothetical protein MY4038_002940 [Beauveria bassiana]